MASGPASIYAQALLGLADERSHRQEVVEDARSLAEAIDADPGLLARCLDPRLGRTSAQKILRGALTGRCAAELIDLICLLIDRHRLDILPSVLAQVVSQAEGSAGVLHVTATTAQDLSAAGRTRLADALGRMLGDGVIMHTDVDPALIGGLTLRIGDLHVDGSIRRQLSDMKAQILRTPVSTALWDQPQGAHP